MKAKRIICYVLCVLMLVSVLAACNSSDETQTTEATTTSSKPSGGNTEEITNSELQEALDAIDKDDTDYSDMKFHILSRPDLLTSFKIDELTDEPLDNAVFERNEAFKDKFKIEVEVTTQEDGNFASIYKSDCKSTKIYDVAFTHTSWNMGIASEGYLYNYLDLDIDYNKPWWDQGTLSFNIADSIWFMNGSFNYDDDSTTYCLMFNKDLAEEHFQSKNLFYDAVTNNEWTLDTFYTYASQVSSDNGDSKWDENDKYGFVTTWEYGITFFYGSGLRFVETKEGAKLQITFDADGIKKATDLLGKLQTLYGKEVTYWPDGGMETVGKEIFWSGRCLFFGEIVSNVIESNKKMDNEFGVLPVPKYDNKQENYLTWTHGISSSMLISDHIENEEKFARVLEGFNVLSHKYVREAYYNVVLIRKSVQDADSAPMLDIIFAGRVYDFAQYANTEMGLIESFKTCVNTGSTNFSSKYSSVKNKASTYLNTISKKFNKLKK